VSNEQLINSQTTQWAQGHRTPSGRCSTVLAILVVVAAFLCGCRAKPQPPLRDAHASAKELFENTTKLFHIPSAEAKGAEKLRLQTEAVAGYERLLKQYPDQDYWAAQALRSLGNIYASQTNLNAAVKEYALVETRYPKQEWEVLMAWKSAADLLWQENRKEEARRFYTKIVQRFDTPESAQVIRTVVRGSRLRLENSLS
jgi:tetratricopeptide (TPR) repeat protein